MTHDPNGAAALALARGGWRVFPVYPIAEDGRCSCEHAGYCAYLRQQGNKKHAECPVGGPCKACAPGKHPATMQGHKDATLNEELIRWWWTKAPWNPAIAIPAHIVVVDIDPRNGGVDTTEKICAAHGEAWARSLSVRSGGGGLQIYLTCDPNRRFPKTLNKHFGPGIDLKQLGGYVLAPPANHKSGGMYSWDESEPNTISPAPEWLLQLSSLRSASGATHTATASLTSIDQLPPPIIEIVTTLGPWENHNGRKFHLCAAVGGLMRKRGFTQAQCEATLRAWLPSNEATVGVAHGLNWAVRAWGKSPKAVSGFGALNDLLGVAHAAQLADAIESTSPSGQQAREWLEQRKRAFLSFGAK